jgi:ribonuclease VapC
VILDSSAVVAILLHERGHERLLDALVADAVVGIGAPTAAESALVIAARLGPRARPLVAEFIREGGIEVLPFREEHTAAALDAYLRYGKGRHKAALNFGDCLAYATAYVAQQPLLFVGDDFAKTDIEPALRR